MNQSLLLIFKHYLYKSRDCIPFFLYEGFTLNSNVTYFFEKRFLSWYYILKIYFKLYYFISFGQIIVLDNKAGVGG